MSAFRRRAAALAAALALALAGCGGRGRVAPEASYQTVSSEALAARLAEAGVEIDALKALARLTVRGQPFEARLLFRRPDRVRLVGFDAFGGSLFDFAAAADAATLRLPGRDAIEVDANAPLALAPATRVRGSDLLRLIQAVAGPHIGADERAVFEQDGRYYLFHVLSDDPVPALRRRLWIDRVDLRLARVDFFDAAGAQDATVRLEDYRSVPLAADGALRPFPFHVVVGRPDGELKLDVRIREAKLNPPIADHELALASPKGGDVR